MNGKDYGGINFFARVIVWLLFFFVGLPGLLAILIIFALATSPDLRAATATVKVLGTSSSKRSECYERQLFAESVVRARADRYTLADAQHDAFVRSLDGGKTLSDACHVVHSVGSIWAIDGNAAGIGNAVYEQCMKEAQ